jgi:Restriction alleviation protein Lar
LSNTAGFAYYPRPKLRYKGNSIEERDAAVERLREFLRLNYMTGAQAAQLIGVRAETLYPWLQGKSRPKDIERIIAFLDSMPTERAGIMPTGYEYREYKNWRGIPKPRRCPFCKQAKGEIRKVGKPYQGVCSNCGATGPRGESHAEALRAWNGRV